MPYDDRTLTAYRRLGVDPEHPNPDGSDYHIMDHVDERLKIEDLAQELYHRVKDAQFSANIPSIDGKPMVELFKSQSDFFQRVRERMRSAEIATSQIRAFLLRHKQLHAPGVVEPDSQAKQFLEGDCWCGKFKMPASYPHRATCKRPKVS